MKEQNLDEATFESFGLLDHDAISNVLTSENPDMLRAYLPWITPAPEIPDKETFKRLKLQMVKAMLSGHARLIDRLVRDGEDYAKVYQKLVEYVSEEADLDLSFITPEDIGNPEMWDAVTKELAASIMNAKPPETVSGMGTDQIESLTFFSSRLNALPAQEDGNNILGFEKQQVDQRAVHPTESPPADVYLEFF